MRWVVAYDVTDDRRRNRVLKILRNYGGQSVQKSVVEADWDGASWEFVFYRVRQAIHRTEDTVIFYRQCADCFERRVELGPPLERQGLLTVVSSATAPRSRRRRRQGKADDPPNLSNPPNPWENNPFGDPDPSQ
jgi:CRISPR-associated protein Cas2